MFALFARRGRISETRFRPYLMIRARVRSCCCWRSVAWKLKCRIATFEMLTYMPRSRRKSDDTQGKVRNITLLAKTSAPTVLVVDDEALIRWSLAEMLGERGYSVTQAGDARSAIAAIQAAPEPFTVVLLDYRLPDSADLRLLETVRHLIPTSHVIMITAYNSPELAQSATALGAYRVISKPFEVESVAALVNEACREPA